MRRPAPSAGPEGVCRGEGATVVDVAGASMGGARRFLDELDRWLTAGPPQQPTLVGQDELLSSTWLVRRELAPEVRRATRTVALNNVTLGTTRRVQRTVLLRNPLHFVTRKSLGHLPAQARAQLAAEAQVVRLAARRADEVVVPTTEMAGRVLHVLPSLCSRIDVRHHPLSLTTLPRAVVPGRILAPVLLAPWKSAGEWLGNLDRACAAASAEVGHAVQALITAAHDELLHEVGGVVPEHLRPIGRVTTEEMLSLYASTQVVLYPTRLESFGYPLAEARLFRIPVVAHPSDLVREVAGDVLVPLTGTSADDLASALVRALRTRLTPLSSNPFDPDAYFTRLLSA